jgi:hypothetical protein
MSNELPRQMEKEEIEAFSMGLMKKYKLPVPALEPGWGGAKSVIGKRVVLAGKLWRLGLPYGDKSDFFLFEGNILSYSTDQLTRNWKPLEFWADYFWSLSVSVANSPGMTKYVDEKKVTKAYNEFFQMKEEQEAVEKFKEAKEAYEKLKRDLPDMLSRAIVRGRLRED